MFKKWFPLIIEKDENFKIQGNQLDIKKIIHNKNTRVLYDEQALNLYLSRFCYKIIPELSLSFYKWLGIVQDNNNEKNVIVVILINKSLLKKYVNTPEKIPNKEFFFEIVQNHINMKFNFSSDIIKSVTQVHPDINREECSYDRRSLYLECNMNLYEFQINNIKWLIERELASTQSHKYVDRKYIVFDNKLIFDSNLIKFNDNICENKICFKGGCLIDSSGLGKTICLIFLSINNPQRVRSTADTDCQIGFSKSTLVITPSYLCYQWRDEIRRVKKRQKVIVVLNNEIDLFKYDFVIVSINNIKPSFFKINWHRIIYDEFQQEVGNSYPLDLKSTYKWCVTSSPFGADKDEMLLKMLNFVSGVKNDSYLTDFKLCKYIIKNIFRKNTRYSIADEYKSIIVEETNRIDFSFMEMITYKYLIDIKTDGRYVQQFCTISETDIVVDSNIIVSKSLDDIKKIIIMRRRNKFMIYMKKMKNISKNIDKIEKYKKKSNTEYNSECEIILNKWKNKRSRCEKKISYFSNNIHILKVFSNIKVQPGSTCDEICQICYEKIYEKCITICAHIFCYNCLHKNININGNCPICRLSIDFLDIFHISKNNKNGIGVKLKAIIKYINGNQGLPLRAGVQTESPGPGAKRPYGPGIDSEGNQYIIYSKWDENFKKISTIFNNNGIKNLIYNGKYNIIKRFRNNNDIKILLISSNNIISGINLQNVSFIIFLEPNLPWINDEINKNKIINCVNSLGRVSVSDQPWDFKIVEFLINDTIECLPFT